MPFKLADWRRLMARFQMAREELARYKAAPAADKEAERHRLDTAVIATRDVAEYCINVHLELRRLPRERRHRTDERARELSAIGQLQADYAKTLEQMERYRQAAQYSGYVRTPSTHYSSANVQDCVEAVQALVAETVNALRAAGKDLE